MNSRLLLCLTLVLSGCLFDLSINVSAADASPPSLINAHVAIFIEDGFPVYGGTPAFPPSAMVETLKKYGVQVQEFSAAELSDPAILNAHRITILIMPYGNAFPESAFGNLRAFHAAGGCLIVNGIPFRHPCQKIDGKWKDLGDSDRFSRSIGIGGFGGLMSSDEDPHASIPGYPLYLKESMLPHDRNWSLCQWLDPSSFGIGVKVFPLVNIVGNDGQKYPLAALIHHYGDSFHGAFDVWMGTAADGMDDDNRYLAEQLLLRGLLWCELSKKKITSAAFSTKLAELDQIPKAKSLPYNLPYVVTPRPWGDTFLPESKPPPRELLVVNADKLNAHERIALACLQGLTSRKQPRIWINRGWIESKQDRPYQDQTWLDWLKKTKEIEGYTIITNWTSLFTKFADSYEGAIVPDPKLYRGNLLAVNVASCEDLIVAAPRLAKRLKLPIKIDLRGRFKTYAEGMNWVWEHYKNRLNHHLCNYLYPSRLKNCAFAYDLQWRGVVFWIAGPVDEHNRGADPIAERRVMAKIFAEMDPNVAVLGYPWNGDGVGLGEGNGVAFASRYAKGLIASDYLANTCVMSGVHVARLTQPQQPPPPVLNKNSIYIALVLSDGDNMGLWMYWYKKYFEAPSFGKFPLAFGMGPEIRELIPSVAQWYYEHASPETEFIADVCGVAYIQPNQYGLAYANRNRVLGGFLDWTARAMRSMGMRTVRAGGNDEILSQYASALPFCDSLFPDYGRSYRNGIKQLTYSLPSGMPVFHAVMSGQYGKQAFLREVREQIGSIRPAFVNGFINCWDFSPKDIANIYDQRDRDMVFVTPTQLATLYREAKAKGWTK